MEQWLIEFQGKAATRLRLLFESDAIALPSAMKEQLKRLQEAEDRREAISFLS